MTAERIERWANIEQRPSSVKALYRKSQTACAAYRMIENHFFASCPAIRLVCRGRHIGCECAAAVINRARYSLGVTPTVALNWRVNAL